MNAQLGIHFHFTTKRVTTTSLASVGQSESSVYGPCQASPQVKILRTWG